MRLRLLAFALVALAQAVAGAQNAPVARITPQTVFDRYLQAMGGRQAIQQVHTMRIKGEMYLDRYSVTPDAWIDRFQDDAGRFYEDRSDKFEQWRSGFDGKEYWVLGWEFGRLPWKIQDPRFKQTHSPSGIGIVTDFISTSKSTEVLGAARVGDSKAIVVRAIAESGDSSLYYFDGDTGLLVRRDSPIRVHLYDQGRYDRVHKRNDEEGAFLNTCFMRLYEVDPGSNVLFARETECKAMDTSRIFRVTKIQVNIPIDDKRFREPN